MKYLIKYDFIIIPIIFAVLFYLGLVGLGQQASMVGCKSGFNYSLTTKQHKFCIAYKKAQYPFFHADFTANGKHYAWNDEIDMYEEIKQVY